MVDMVAKAKALILGLLTSAAATAATVDLTLPPGDYYLVPVQPYTVVTIQSQPIDPPVLDTDGDGVNDDIDQCPDTPLGDEVDTTGCTVVPPPVDSDGDGIPDDVDQCPTVPAQTEDGCPIDPPSAGGDVLSAIVAMAPTQHPTEARFVKIPGSEVDVFADCADYDYGDTFKCAYSWRAFTDYTGGTWDMTHYRLNVPAGGGHYDYGGNELYVGQLIVNDGVLGVKWSRPIDPQPLTEGQCGYPVYGPSSSHTYAGPVYVSSKDEVWHFAGSSPYPTASHCPSDQFDKTPGMGAWVNNWDSWRQVQPHVAGNPIYPRACYLSGIDRIIALGATKRYLINPSDGYSYTEIPTFQSGWISASGAFDSAADVSENICYEYIKGKGIAGFRYDQDGSAVETFRSSETTLNVPSLSVDPQTGNLVIVGVNGYAQYVDVLTDTIVNISSSDGIESGDSKGYIYGKFDMVPNVPCVGIGIADGRNGMYLMTLPENVCDIDAEPIVVVPPVIENPTEPTPLSGVFVEKCEQPGVVFCDPLGANGPYVVTDSIMAEVPNPDGTQGLHMGKWWGNWRGLQSFSDQSWSGYDSEIDALKVVRGDGASSSGLFTTSFSPDMATQFGEGESFSVEFQFRYNCEFVYLDCDPQSHSYKTDRRPFLNAGGGTQGAKIVILAEGDDPDKPGNACDVIQIVPSTNYGTIRGFNDCGKFYQWEKAVGMAGGSVQFERNTGADYSCLRFPTGDNSVRESWEKGGVGPNCAMIESDQWMTLRITVDVGHWDQHDTRLRIDFALEDEPLRQVVDMLIPVRKPDGHKGYGKIWFQIHSTKSQTGIGDPDRIAWYRNLIVKAL